MARTEQVMQGRVGNAVFYRVKGRTYIRSLPLKYQLEDYLSYKGKSLKIIKSKVHKFGFNKLVTF